MGIIIRKFGLFAYFYSISYFIFLNVIILIYLFVEFMIQFASNLPMPTYQPTLKSTWKDIMVNLEG